MQKFILNQMNKKYFVNFAVVTFFCILLTSSCNARNENLNTSQNQNNSIRETNKDTKFKRKKNSKKMNNNETNFTETASGLKFKDVEVGTGNTAKSGQKVSVHYTGTLYPTGEKFDSSKDRGIPFEFSLGVGQVIKGWDEGVEGMKIGGKRILIIPPDLAYGKSGAGGVIPPNATLQFEVDLLGLK